MSENARDFERESKRIQNVPIDATLARRMHATEIANQWLEEIPLIFDTETTGLGHDAEICEIAIIDGLGRKVFQSLVQPTKTIPADAFEIHGISNAMVANAPTFEGVQHEIAELFRGKLVLGWNVPFDLRMLVQSAKPFMFPFACHFIGARCVMELYAYWLGEWDYRRGKYRWQKLVNAAASHSIEVNGPAHRALVDAELTRRVLRFIANYRPMFSEEEGGE